MRRFAAAVEDHAEELAQLETANVGKPISDSRDEVAMVAEVLHFYAGAVDKHRGATVPVAGGVDLTFNEPLGVVAAIVPWNFPIAITSWKVGPALATGNTVVVKPAELTPLTALRLEALALEAGIPPGVLQVVVGAGPVAGARLVEHPDVAKVAFTGSTAVGREVMATASRTIKRVTLELGGKSANVILDDADLETAVKVGVSNAFLNGGQTCTAWTRMLVPAGRQEDALELAKRFAEGFRTGDPLDPATKLGPMVSRAQRDRVRGFIERGIEEGARLVTGGAEAPEGREAGYFVAPTVFGQVHPDSTLAQEEIFGPVLSVLPYRDEADALAIANNSRYGLHGAVWSADQDRAVRFARGVRTGQIDVNGGAYNPLAPFGGYKQSGIGREMGRLALDEFTEVKSIQL
jgi:aldehyde dehydrogenase (NAD+)